MIIGDGDIASVLRKREGIRFFASGVSNSQEIRNSEYEREKKLLNFQSTELRLVYFSSLSIFYSNGRYQRHKREMEELVKQRFPKYCIMRIGNITWGNNRNTIINYLKSCIVQEKPITIKDEYRYLIDAPEFIHWVNLIPDFNCEMNLTGKRMKVAQIVKEYVL